MRADIEQVEQMTRVIAVLIERLGGVVVLTDTEWARVILGPTPDVVISRAAPTTIEVSS